MKDVIYQSSDLAGARRTDFLRDARAGRARLRDKDGTSLVMLPETELSALENFAHWSRFASFLNGALQRNESLGVTELGEHAWLRVFDNEDLEEFLSELMDALVASLADKNDDLLDELVSAWRVTARQLQDPLRRSVLLSLHEPTDFEKAEQPDDGS